jgi:hypothetical protein
VSVSVPTSKSRHEGESPSLSTTRPDFATLYRPAGVGSELTPRTASAIYTSLCLVTDGIALDTVDHGDTPVGADPLTEWRVLDALPPAAWSQGLQWRCQLSGRGRRLVRTVERGGGVVADCVADYLLQHVAIDRARDEVDDARRDSRHPSHSMPAYPADYLWHRLPYHNVLGDLDASRSAPQNIALLHQAYRATADCPDRWFEHVSAPVVASIIRDDAGGADEQVGPRRPAQRYGRPTTDPLR